MITVIKQGNAYNRRVISLEGLSTDAKPVEYFIETDSNGVEVARVYIENGSTFTEIDTGKLFMYDAENNAWYEIETSGGGGGEPGTTNYNDLTNKPSVNGHTLIGAKTSSDLDLQPVISDLSTIRSGAALGATAVQPSDMEEALDDKVDKVEGKGLSTNDFTNQDKEQITINKNGLAALEQMNGKKNWIDVNVTSQTVSTLDFGVNSDNTIVVDGSKPSSAVSLTINEAVQLPAGDYVLLDGSGVSSSTLNITLFRNTSTRTGTTATNGKFEFTANGTDTYYCRIYVNTVVDNVTFKPMIISKAAYDAGFTDYQAYAPTNRELWEKINSIKRTYKVPISSTPANNIYFGVQMFPFEFDSVPNATIKVQNMGQGGVSIDPSKFTTQIATWGFRIYTTDSSYAGLIPDVVIS